MPADKALEWGGPVDRLHRNTDALMSGAMVIARQLAKGPRALAGLDSAGVLGTGQLVLLSSRSRPKASASRGCKTW